MQTEALSFSSGRHICSNFGTQTHPPMGKNCPTYTTTKNSHLKMRPDFKEMLNTHLTYWKNKVYLEQTDARHVFLRAAERCHRGTLEGFSALQILAQVGEFHINLVSSNKLKHFKKIFLWSLVSFLDGRSWSSEKVVVYVGQYFPVSECLWANVSPWGKGESFSLHVTYGEELWS